MYNMARSRYGYLLLRVLYIMATNHYDNSPLWLLPFTPNGYFLSFIATSHFRLRLPHIPTLSTQTTPML